MKVYFKICRCPICFYWKSFSSNPLYELEGVGHTLRDPLSMSPNASNHKEQQHIWFRGGVLYKPHMNWRGWDIPPGRSPLSVTMNNNIYGLGVEFWMVPKILSLMWTGPHGAYPMGTHGWCNWMHLIIRNKNICGYGVGIWIISEILSLIQTGGGGA